MKHLACIADGSRRWAKARNLPFYKGYEAGMDAIGRVVNFCQLHAISYLTLYLFSIENFKRPHAQITYLFTTVEKKIAQFTQTCRTKQICVRIIGTREMIPATLLCAFETLENQTKAYSKTFLTIAFCYGGQQEIVHAARACAHAVQQGALSVDALTPKTFSSYLSTVGIPDPDVILRTGGQKRLSNFLLYQAAYAELFFLDTLWPDITNKALTSMYQTFEQTKRSWGA